MTKTVLSIQDFCSLGRCALTVTIPVLSAVGVQPIGLPTSYFSNHPHFPHMSFSDMSDKAMNSLLAWKKNNSTFDAIQTGFISHPREMDVILKAIELFHQPDDLLVVDPAMADNGKLYPIFDHTIVDAMKELASYATCVTPNYTEVLLMTGREYEDKLLSEEEIYVLCKEMVALGPKYVVMTSIPTKENEIRTCLYNGETDTYSYIDTPKISLYAPGTGDIFTAVLTGSLVRGKSFQEAVKKAVEFTYYCVEQTAKKQSNPIFGVELEYCLNKLL